jgi:hypothetical protein
VKGLQEPAFSQVLHCSADGIAGNPVLDGEFAFGRQPRASWLNGGVYPTQVAEWAEHGVDVLLRIYAKCIVGQDELAKRRISEALRQG